MTRGATPVMEIGRAGFISMPTSETLERNHRLLNLEAVLSIIDGHRGSILAERKQHTKGTDGYGSLSRRLDLLNRLKKEISLVSDADQRSLGL
jgi:hypothetical protein